MVEIQLGMTTVNWGLTVLSPVTGATVDGDIWHDLIRDVWRPAALITSEIDGAIMLQIKDEV